MKITVITLFPAMVEAFLGESIVKRAIERGVVSVEIVNLRDFATDNYGTVDDRPYGGGAGMVLKAPILHAALQKLKIENGQLTMSQAEHSQFSIPHTILTSAKGAPYTQQKAKELSQLDNIVIVCGHYEGVDERIMDEIDEEVSIGDFVMTGGEIAAAAIVDSVVRLLPGALKKDDATSEESFMQVNIHELVAAVGSTNELSTLLSQGAATVRILEYPHYTRPEVWQDKAVPEVLLSGDPKKIRVWKLQQAYKQTVMKRKDLLLHKEIE